MPKALMILTLIKDTRFFAEHPSGKGVIWQALLCQ